MFGVVLWYDQQMKNAVIWCEDHGDLAFCQNTKGKSRQGLDVGDWVQFDLTTGRRQRYARNLRLVRDGAYCGLTDVLSSGPELDRQKGPAMPAPDRAEAARSSAEIIPFASPRSPNRALVAASGPSTGPGVARTKNAVRDTGPCGVLRSCCADLAKLRRY